MSQREENCTTNHLCRSSIESAERERTIERRLLLEAFLKLGVKVSVNDVLVQDRLWFKILKGGAEDAVEADLVLSQDVGRDVSLHAELIFGKNLWY